MVGSVSALSVGVVGDLGYSVDVWLSISVVVVAVPHNVIGIGSLSFALWMVAEVSVVNASGLEAIWGSNAPRKYGGEESAILFV